MNLRITTPFAASISLEVVDLVVARRPLFLAQQLVDARNEDVLVVRAVEDADHPARRNLRVDAPEKIVTRLDVGRRLEARDGAALRIDRGEDFANRAVLAGGVAPLQNDEQRVARVGVEDALQLGDSLDLLFGRLADLVVGLLEAVDARIGIARAGSIASR